MAGSTAATAPFCRPSPRTAASWAARSMVVRTSPPGFCRRATASHTAQLASRLSVPESSASSVPSSWLLP